VRKKHQCDLCGKIITERWGMRTHLLTMHGIVPKDTSEKSVRECNRCGKRFLCPTKYKDHMNMHDGIRPYGCPLCDVRMVKYANLQQHCKRLHGRTLVLDHDPTNTNGCYLADDVPGLVPFANQGNDDQGLPVSNMVQDPRDLVGIAFHAAIHSSESSILTVDDSTSSSA
jgi:hypothetical protein